MNPSGAYRRITSRRRLQYSGKTFNKHDSCSSSKSDSEAAKAMVGTGTKGWVLSPPVTVDVRGPIKGYI